MDDFYYEESNSKGVLIKIIIAIVIIGVIIFVGYIFLNASKLKIKKTIKLEAGETLPEETSYYITGSIIKSDTYTVTVDGYELGDVLDKTGEYTYTVKHNKDKATGTIIVKDTTAPKVEVESLTVGVNEDIDLNEFVTSCEDYSKPCSVSAKNENDEEAKTTAGEYNFDIIVTDKAGNKTTKSVTLIVKENYSREEEKKKDLTVVKVDPSYDDYNNEIYYMFDEGFDPGDDDTEQYDYILEFLTKDSSEILPEEYQGLTIEDQELIYAYNKYGYVVGFTSRIKLSDGKYIYLNNN